VLKRKTLTSQVIDYVVAMIRSGEVKPGERLPTETELTQTLGVSRTCVREAIKSLESLGLITVRARVGATLLEPSASSLLNAEQFSLALQSQRTDDLLEFRKIMEVGLASLAAEKAEQLDLDQMRAALDRFKAEIETNRSDCATDMSFHSALAAASKNPIAVMVWQMLSARLAQILSRTITLPNVCEDSLRDHEQIYAAIKNRNARKAREAMRTHLENADRIWRIAFSETTENGAQPGHVSSTKADKPVPMPR
jgi:DNA-binding FadR family transcriptional regulator